MTQIEKNENKLQILKKEVKDMYFEDDYKFVNENESNSLQDDCLAALGVAMMMSQLSA